MNHYQMGEIESRFAEIIWANEPISSTELAKISAREFEWKKSTTYTVLKRLCEKGIFKNEKGCVTSLVSREELYAVNSERFVEENFKGSLPAFLAAFSSRKRLSESEIQELRKLIEEHENE
ncbi:MAG: BlaI/MecI/CopY family transcriptional regulator [Clostridia bacterium]|nr:BlaI/MecI/CopY family transcriptional regulator [Clostridia bacterium]MBQ9848467.1 BlaI/MecI/CopY family transcriptional regulator [Clostridia bacterium]